MPSYTPAQQLFGSDISADLEDALAARVKDPLWFLARQWQTGEFEAENGGRLAFMGIDWREFPLTQLARGGARTAVKTDAPLEFGVEQESDAGDSPAWRAEALEYRFDAHTAAHDLSAEDYEGRRLDWFHFDLERVRPQAPPAQTGSRRITPTQANVRGAPHPRWWRLEDSQEQIGLAEDPEPNALSMVLPEFFLLDVNNWYVAPLEQTAGSVHEITALQVVDSFGVVTKLEPATASWANAAFRLFSLSADDTAAASASGRSLFVPNIAVDLLGNDELEEVRFLRDEEANLVWAFERRYRDSDGRTVLNGDRRGDGAAGGVEGADNLPRFRLRSDLPAHFIPYLPRQLEPTPGVIGDIYLRRGRSVESASRKAPQYRTRLVAESWRLNEHEVPRTGIRVRRLNRFARGSDGQPYFWVGRQKDPAERTATPRLRTDHLVESGEEGG